MLKYVTVVGGELSLRAEPSVDSEKISSIPEGSVVAVVESVNLEWDKVVFNSFTGYAMHEFLKEARFENDTITIKRDLAVAFYEALKVALNK